MPDQISLVVNNQELTKFRSYSVDADFYLAADAFQVEAAGIIPGITEGQRVQLKVNGITELDGLIDCPRRSGEKGKASMKISGRNLAGLLVDTHCDGYGDIKNVTLQALTEKLIAKVPFIQRNNVFYKFPKDTPALTWETVFVDPGRPIFDALSEKAKAAGFVFYAMPEGQFYFGKPKTTGEVKFHITLRRDGKGNNVLNYDYAPDLSKRYSEVNVISNGQGTDAKPTSQLSIVAKVKDPTFPFYKPFYAIECTGVMTPHSQAQMIMDMQRRQGFQLTYKVPEHSQNGKNWAINELCSVDDEVNELKGTYFLYGRRFGLSKEEGKFTEIRLAPPGLL